MPKVLISDSLSPRAVEIFRERGVEVDVKTGLKPEELKAIIGDYDGLAIRSATKVTKDILSSAPRLKVVGRAGIGVDNVEIPAANVSTQAGKWEKNRFMGVELTAKVLGVVGCGNIGSIVAERALGLKMRVVAFDPFLSHERALLLGVEKVELDELLRRADVISLHTPLTDKTKNI